MAFWDFTKKNHNEQLDRLNKLSNLFENGIQNLAHQIDSRLDKLHDKQDKLEKSQKETQYQLEDIDSFLQDSNDVSDIAEEFVKTVVSLIDSIYDFYLFSIDQPALFEQAQAMFNKAVKSADDIGLDVIVENAESEATFDFRLHTIEAAVPSLLPPGQIIQVLQCGYIYQDIILRKASVMVSKEEDNK